uniref:Uncharacterized protein n=1 Tax=Romanomermis culicivorax TaxID=13658 RepID=A0A915IFL2_ROMCU
MSCLGFKNGHCSFFSNHLSHARITQAAISQKDKVNVSRTVPGDEVINVLIMNCDVNVIRFNAPILRLEASVHSLLRTTSNKMTFL